MQMTIEDRIKQEALRIGFSHVGVCSVEPGEQIELLRRWLDQNYHGTMKWMENRKRVDPSLALQGIRTMIVVGLNYRWPDGSDAPQEAMISKYAWSADYHRVMSPMVQDLASYLQKECTGAAIKTYVDTGPVAEKYWAQKAGVGWIGKHTNVLSRSGSSWFFLGVLLTDATLNPDRPAEDHCGSCTQCIEACPTRAIVGPYQLDARLCISYLTIELRESIPRELRPLIGHRIFGCDDCQDVCPWNRYAYAGDVRFTPRDDILAATLRDYLHFSIEDFRRTFAGTNVLRTKYVGFIRNCLVAAGNAKDPNLIPDICHHLDSEHEMIREHAIWALGQIDDPRATETIRNRRKVETCAAVLEEIDLTLSP